MIDRDYGEVEHGDCPYSWLNEWLCEYVDGTMDPSLRAVFDEYLKANPELAEHVERLCRTRTLLCQCKGHQSGPDVSELRARLREESESELMQVPFPFLSANGGQLGMTVAAGSAMLVMLTVGVVIGATLFAAEPFSARREADRAAVPPSKTEASTNVPFQAFQAPTHSFSTLSGTFFSPFVHEPALHPVGRGATGGMPSLVRDPSPVDTTFQLVISTE